MSSSIQYAFSEDVKANAVGRKRARNRPALMRNLRIYLNHRRDNPSLVMRYFHENSVVMRYFHENSVRYAAN